MPSGSKKAPRKQSRKLRKVAPKTKHKKLNCVKVPKQLEPIFAKAQEFVGKYFSTLKGDASEGTIDVEGERYLLVRAASMSVDFFETVKDLYKGAGEEEALSVARNLLFDIAHAIGKADAKSFQKKMKLEDPLDKLSAGPIHFAYSGWAFVDILPESSPSPDENYYLIYDHPFSFESAAWLKAEKKSSCPVCIMNSGYSSGWCEESYNMSLVAQEIMCKAAGDKVCRFIMAPPSKIEEHIKRYVKKKPTLAKRVGTYEVPGFFKRKQIEQELQCAAEEWLLTFDSMADGVTIHTKDYAITNVNKAICTMLGMNREELIGKKCYQVFHGTDAPINECPLKSVLSLKKIEHVEFYESHMGIWLAVSASPIFDEVGKVVKIIHTVRDITERKRMEEELRAARNNMEQRVELRTAELRKSQQLYQTLAEAAEDYIYIIRPDMTVRYVNDFGAKALQRSKDEVVGKSLHKLFPSEASVRMEGAVGRVFSSGEAIFVENPLQFPNGEIWLHTRLVPLKNGKDVVTDVMGLSRDITKRKETEEALKASERRFQQVTESAEEWIWEVNKDGLYTYSNDVVKEVLGYKPEEIVGMMYFYDFFITEEREGLKKAAFGVFGKKEPFKGFVNVNVHKDGRHVILETSGSPVVDKGGNLIGYRGVDTDITEHKKAEETLRSALKMKSEFMAMMSHELRTPLTRIISSTHLVLRDRDVALPKKRVNNLNNVLSSSDALLLIINNVLEMARLEGGSVPVFVQECDLRYMVRTSISGYEGMTEDRSIKFVTDIADAAATIYTDKEKLGHIVMNLICNAIRYSDRGTIEITAKTSKKPGCVDIAVSDEGVGISFEKKSQLFEPFKQLEDISKRRPGGIGLGLAIVKANLELIGGSIDVKSEVGKGSTFTVTIPKELSKENI